MRAPAFVPTDFPILAREKSRLGDTDIFGHINNVSYATFLEIGRSALLNTCRAGVAAEAGLFIVANMSIDYLHEMTWPGEIVIGSKIARIGRSSLTFEQGLFQNDAYCAHSLSTLVRLDLDTRKTKPIEDELRAKFEALM